MKEPFKRRLATNVGAGVDHLATRAALVAMSARPRRRGRRRVPQDTETRLSLLGEIIEAWPTTDAVFHVPRVIEPVERVVKKLRGGALLELRWPSDRPRWMPELDPVLAHPRSDRAAARLWAHESPRRTIVLAHGYMAGHWDVERVLWPIDRWYRGGWDVALLVLPHHGARAELRRMAAPRFPSRDPRRTNEGLRQVVGDLGDLARWLRGRGAPAVGLMGMSLGAYAASLTATVEPGLDFLVPVIPLASIADFALARGHLGRGEGARLQHDALDRAHRALSPLHRAPRIAAARTLVLAARGDRITPLSHAERLAAHFGSELLVRSGSHLLQVWRAGGYRAATRFLEGVLGG